MGSEAAIFKRPSRYGWGASDRRPGSAAQPEEQTQTQSRTNNRFGHNENKRKPPSSQDSGSNSSNSDSGPSSGPDSGSGPGNTASNDRDNGSDSGGDDKKKMADGGSSNSGDSSSSSTSDSGNSSVGAPPSNLNDYPYANLVPGKKGAVTLPGVGEIDVTGIKPGTPVEIDDPNKPGKKIYFRVP